MRGIHTQTSSALFPSLIPMAVRASLGHSANTRAHVSAGSHTSVRARSLPPRSRRLCCASSKEKGLDTLTHMAPVPRTSFSLRLPSCLPSVTLQGSCYEMLQCFPSPCRGRARWMRSNFRAPRGLSLADSRSDDAAGAAAAATCGFVATTLTPSVLHLVHGLSSSSPVIRVRVRGNRRCVKSRVSAVYT